MSTALTPLHGVIHGKTIELVEAPGLPDGQKVVVLLQSWSGPNRLPPGEGLRRAFGACAGEAAEVNQFIEWNREQRQLDHRRIDGWLDS